MEEKKYPKNIRIKDEETEIACSTALKLALKSLDPHAKNYLEVAKRYIELLEEMC